MARSTLGPVGFVATSMACAVSLGLLIITATVLGVDELRPQSGAGKFDQSFYLLVGGTLGGIFLAGYAGWRLLDLISSTYRRGALALVCGFATVLLMLICIPVHQLFGRTGLYLQLGVCGVVAALLGRRAASARINA